VNENETSDPMAEMLEAERPVPRAAFRGELRRALLTRERRKPQALPRLRLMIAAYAGSGAVLLGIAAVGVAGVGPFAPG
jgi:hypothetical protein